MIQLIDTHTHLYLPEFDSDRDETVYRARNSGIVKMLMPNIDLKSAELMIAVEKRYPDICLSMLGLHPTSVKDDYLSQLEKLEDLIRSHKFIAIGEIGIDLYWDKTFLREQLFALRRQITFATQLELPVVIHSRESFTEVFSIIDEFRGEKIKGVFHAFTGDMKNAERIIESGFKLGIGGIVTFKNSGLDEIVKEVGPEHIILETDSPYLAPAPHRGKRNESSYIGIINKKLAEILEMSEEKVASVTLTNSIDLFNITN